MKGNARYLAAKTCKSITHACHVHESEIYDLFVPSVGELVLFT